MAAGRGPSSAGARVLREYVAEAEEILERLRADLADLADAHARGTPFDPECVNRLFRSAHTLKGLAASVGQEAAGRLAHRLEDVLDRLRMGRLAADAPIVALVDEAVGGIAALVAAVQQGGAQDVPAPETDDLCARMDAALAREAGAGSTDPGIELDPAVRGALTEYEEHRLTECVRAGRCVHWVEADLPLDSFEEGLAELTRAARERGELLATLPGPGDAPETHIRFGLLVASELDAGRFRARLGEGARVRPLHPPEGPPAEEGTGPVGPPTPPAPAAAPPPAPGRPELGSLRSIAGTVRVDIRKLDELMNLVGELVIQRAALGALARRTAIEPATARMGAELESIHDALDDKLQELQAAVLDVRMVPLAHVFEKLSRVVRRLHRDLGKEVRLEIRGAETELDKLIVEDLVDPLMHVVRNAFDHAIESPEERAAAGKPAEGRIRIEAYQRGNHVVIEVHDDGRGIDAEAVRTRAVERGLLPADATPTRQQIVEMLLAPGFSTREAVTETSGRGVGLDVVRSNVMALGGLLDLDWTPGCGTRVTFTLPITLAIVQALLVRAGGQRFAIPLASVHETLLVGPDALQRSESGELLDLRGAALPLRRLAREFALPEDPAATELYVVVVGLADLRFGLVVDHLDGQRDAVIKPIHGPVAGVRGIAGATELGREGAVLVLDVSALAEDALGGREAA